MKNHVPLSFRPTALIPKKGWGRRLPSGSALLAVILALLTPASAQTEGINFETIAPDLPGWRAGANIDGQSPSWGASANSEFFTVSLSSEKPKSGGNCLAIVVLQETTGLFVNIPEVEVSGAALEIRFFTRSEGLGVEGLFNVQQFDGSGQRIDINWGVAKIVESDAWNEVVCHVKLKPDTQRIRMGISFPKAAAAGGRFWLDDLSFKTTAVSN